jgi:predicted alpha/beta-hydrolase family hydrolase
MNERCEEFTDTTDAPVRGFLHRPERDGADGLVLTHGAGANAQSPLLTALADAFCTAGLMVLRCDLPFRQARPHGPPPRGSAERDQEGLRAAVAAMRRQTAGRIFLGGHSYGGRQASMLAAGTPDLAEALLLLSYPLHPPRHFDQLRTAHFSQLRIPAVFVHGTRDPFGSIAEMEAALALIPARTALHAVEGAGHELLARANREALPKTVVETFLAFVGR